MRMGGQKGYREHKEGEEEGRKEELAHTVFWVILLFPVVFLLEL